MQQNEIWRTAIRYVAWSMQIPMAIITGSLAGDWLDNKFATQPWLFLTGIALGSLAAMVCMYRINKQIKKDF